MHRVLLRRPPPSFVCPQVVFHKRWCSSERHSSLSTALSPSLLLPTGYEPFLGRPLTPKLWNRLHALGLEQDPSNRWRLRFVSRPEVDTVVATVQENRKAPASDTYVKDTLLSWLQSTATVDELNLCVDRAYEAHATGASTPRVADDYCNATTAALPADLMAAHTPPPPWWQPHHQRCVDLALEGQSLYIGCTHRSGKSLVLQRIYVELARRGVRVVLVGLSAGLCAQTGAVSLFQAFCSATKWNEFDIHHLRLTDCVLFDECSVLSEGLFDQLERSAREARFSEEFFGGIQVIAAGDFLLGLPGDRVSTGFLFSSRAFGHLRQLWLPSLPLRSCRGDRAAERCDPGSNITHDSTGAPEQQHTADEFVGGVDEAAAAFDALLKNVRVGLVDERVLAEGLRYCGTAGPWPSALQSTRLVGTLQKESEYNEKVLATELSGRAEYAFPCSTIFHGSDVQNSANVSLLVSRGITDMTLRDLLYRSVKAAHPNWRIRRSDFKVFSGAGSYLDDCRDVAVAVGFQAEERAAPSSASMEDRCAVNGSSLSSTDGDGVVDIDVRGGLHQKLEKCFGTIPGVVVVEVSRDTPTAMSERASGDVDLDSDVLPVRLKIGCRVMITRNLSPTVKHGAVGEVVGVAPPSSDLLVGGDTGRYARAWVRHGHNAAQLLLPLVQLIDYHDAVDSCPGSGRAGTLVQVPYISRSVRSSRAFVLEKMFIPLKLAYALTMQKTRGIHLSGPVVVDAAEIPQCDQIVYGMLSSVSDCRNLYITGLKPSHVRVHPACRDFMAHVEALGTASCVPLGQPENGQGSNAIMPSWIKRQLGNK